MNIPETNEKPIIVGAKCFIPLEYVNKFRIARIKKDLTFGVMLPDKYEYDVPEEILLFEIEKDRIAVPRLYAYTQLKDILSSCPNIEMQLAQGEKIDIGFSEEAQSLDPEKKEKQDALIAEFLAKLNAQETPFKGGLMQAPPGYGKTVCALKVASILGRTTLVVLHKEFLVNQWLESALKFTSLKKEDIGIVQQDKCIWEGKKLIFALIQSLCSREYPQEFYSYIGHLAVDECHRLGATEWSQVVGLFPAVYRTGYSATIARTDGREDVFYTTIGPVLAKRTTYDVIPKVYQVRFPVTIRGWYQDIDLKTGEVVKIYLGRLISFLVSDMKRNEWIVNEVIKACQNGRKAFIISDRKNHLRCLKALFDAKVGGKFTSGFYMGNMSDKQLRESKEANAIFGTYAMSAEGLDIPSMDTIYLATPHTNIEQAVGRILRKHEGKKEPLIIDIVDDEPVCIKFAMKRFRFYRKRKFVIAKSYKDWQFNSLESKKHV